MNNLDKKLEEMQPTKVYGYVPPQPTEKDYVFGGYTKLEKIIVNPSKDWSSAYPTFESQLRPSYDSAGCTVYASNNGEEAYLKLVLGKDYDLAERYHYNLVGILPPGADPMKVLQSKHDNGDIPESVMPVTDTFEEFSAPRPVPQKYKTMGKEFPYTFNYEILWTGGKTKKERIDIIRECLAYSVILVSVTAWNEKNGVYVDGGMRNNHLTMLGREVAGLGFEVFDSYADNAGEATKIISYDHAIEFAVRIMVVPKAQKEALSWIEKLLIALKQAIYHIVSNTPTKEPVVVATPFFNEPDLPPDESKPITPIFPPKETIPQIITRVCTENGVEPELGLAVAECEGGTDIPDRRGRVDNRDRGIFQINSRWHPQVTDEQANNPEWATKWFCQMVKGGQLKTTWKASLPCWRNKLSLATKMKYKV